MRWRRGSNALWLFLGEDQFGRENFLRIRQCPESLFLTFLIEDERRPGYVVERIAKRPDSRGQSREVITWRRRQANARQAGEEWITSGAWNASLYQMDVKESSE